jgi:membrane-bound lytic murein transglycosylase D
VEKTTRYYRPRETDKPKSRFQISERNRRQAAVEFVPIVEKTPSRTAAKKAIYTVQRGETLWAVARKHSIDVKLLAKWNNFSERTAVKAGQTLVVWNKEAAKKSFPAEAATRSPPTSRYTVREGDTLFSISRRFKVSVAELRKWNGSNVEKQMQPGRNITVLLEKD